MRTNSSKHGQERDHKISDRQSSQYNSQDNDQAEDNSAHTSGLPNPRSRGIMLQQSIERPSDKMRVSHANNMNVASSLATSNMTSP